MSARKNPRRVCPVCLKSFMNGQALRDHRYHMRDEPAHAAARRAKRPVVVIARKRTFDLT